MRVVRISLLLLALLALVVWQVQSPVATQAAEESPLPLTLAVNMYGLNAENRNTRGSLESVFASRESAVMAALTLSIKDERAVFGTANQVDTALQTRLNSQTIISAKVSSSNPRVLIACLPSLNRLRGRVSTRWYAPSDCPAGHR